MPPSRLGRLLRLAETRKRDEGFASISFRVYRPLRESLYARCAEDGITVPAVLEALLRGFVTKHPAALAMVDQWIRDEGLDRGPKSGKSVSDRELAELYAAIARGEEET